MDQRRIKAQQIKNSVMQVNENTFAVPSQFREGKAHIVKFEEIELPVYVDMPRIKELKNIINCSQRHQEFVIKAKNLIIDICQIVNTEKKYTCTCEDYAYNGLGYCKHILAVQMNKGEI